MCSKHYSFIHNILYGDRRVDTLIAFTSMTTILLALYHQLMSIKHIKWFSLRYQMSAYDGIRLYVQMLL